MFIFQLYQKLFKEDAREYITNIMISQAGSPVFHNYG